MCTDIQLRWPVAVPSHKQIDVVVVHEAFATCVKDAWQYLLENGKKVAQDAGIKPEDIVLGGISSHRPANKNLLTHPSNARWDAPRLLRQRLPTSAIRDESKYEGSSVRRQPVAPAANARDPSASWVWLS